jgi:hypothetical protein
MKNSINFGPDGSKQVTSLDEWGKIAKEKDLLVLPVSSGLVAQTKNSGICMGAWFYDSKKGWIFE